MRPALRFLLAHHGYFEFDRCLRLRICEKEVFFCARCSGIYVGIAVSAIAAMNGLMFPPKAIAALLLLPAPAFLDWGLHVFGVSFGSNFLRVSSGVLLGVGYAGYAVSLTSVEHRGPALAAILFWLVTYRVLLFKLTRVRSIESAPSPSDVCAPGQPK